MDSSASSPQPVQADTDTAIDSDQLQLVSFWVGQEEYAFDILRVREINRMMTITAVPKSPEVVEGVINLRGLIIPVIDLRKQFGVADTSQSEDSRIVVVEVDQRIVGFIVDKVNEVLRINQSIVDPPPSIMTGVNSDYIQGVGKLEDRLLILLDLDRLFNGGDLTSIQNMSDAA